MGIAKINPACDNIFCNNKWDLVIVDRGAF